ncbi:MAG: UDP-3-O-acyl-N-acetylglucosamine deacetylase [Alphaproteobacteria bacterium]
MARGRAALQTTLKRRVALKGTGVHSGGEVAITLNPAEPDSGICFVRTEADGSEIRADYDRVGATDHCTTLRSGGGIIITIEHIMAALSGLGVDNALIEVDGNEIPIMDGSAEAFVDAIDHAGRRSQAAPRRYIKVLEPVRVQSGEATAEWLPHDGLQLDITIDFASELIGRQRFVAEMNETVFREKLARSRTFGFLVEVEDLWQRGLALGASLENAVVIGDDAIVNPEGLRFDDEFVRHKALDSVGDLALAGAPILGQFRSYRGGHKLNVMAVEALMADEGAWTYVEQPVRPEYGHAELPAGIGAPTYGPDSS